MSTDGRTQHGFAPEFKGDTGKRLRADARYIPMFTGAMPPNHRNDHARWSYPTRRSAEVGAAALLEQFPDLGTCPFIWDAVRREYLWMDA